MTDFFLSFLKLFILFSRNAIGCLNSPYITYRKLSSPKTEIGQTVFVFFLVLGYFAFASFLKVGIAYPFILTLKFNFLLLFASLGFLGMIFFLYLLGRLVGGEGRLLTIFVLWSYSLLPTIFWFLATSFLFLLLPPPRTLSLGGKMFSVIFISSSLTLFFWKLLLYYLTLRFGMRLDLWRIAIVSFIIAPILLGYSIFMYRLGIFRIPFL